MEHDIKCIGFIMDGNRRFAKERGLPVVEGHLYGKEVMKVSIEWVEKNHIPHAVYYAFSTENWKRSELEVTYLMNILKDVLLELLNDLDEKAVRFRIIGRRTDFSPELQTLMSQLEMASAKYNQTTIWIALSYGGRAEIVAAVNDVIKEGKPVNETDFEKRLWTAELPDPDVIVRPGGEHRLSNFLTWRSVYSELIFLDKNWPALTKDDFDGILKEYAIRERRKGA